MMLEMGLEESLSFFKFLIDEKLVGSLEDAISRSVSIDAEFARINKNQDVLFSVNIDNVHHAIVYKKICLGCKDSLANIVHRYELVK